MTEALSPALIQRFVDSNGNALVGGKLFTYAAGTTTKQATYTDSGGGTQQTNPIILNARGEPENNAGNSIGIWVSNLPYKFVLSPSTDTDPPTNPIWTLDNVSTLSTATIPNDTVLGNVSGVSAVPYPLTSLQLTSLVNSRTFLNISSLRSNTVTLSAPYAVFVAGYYAGADGGDGYFWMNPSDVSSMDNGGTLIVDAANQRWYREYGALPLSVRWFGAVGDGTTDDTTALQATINASTGAVYLPTGIYNITTGLTCTYGIHMFGDGVAKTILLPATTIAALAITTPSAVLIEDFYIDYASPQSGGLYGITITATSPATNSISTIRNVQISGADGGIQLTNSAFYVIDRCFIENFAHNGIQVSNSNNADVGDGAIIDCTFFGFTSEPNAVGIYWLSGGGLRVSNNKFGALNIGVDMVYASSGNNTAQLLVTGNSFDTMSTVAISAVRSGSNLFNSVIIEGNVFPDCGVGVSIPYDAGGNWISVVVISGNEYIGAGSGSPVGFEVNSVTEVNISDNSLFGNAAATVGISLGAAVSTGIVQGNNLSGTFTTTIFVDPAATAVRVLDNQGYNPVGAAVLTPGATPWTYTAGTSPSTLYVSDSSGITAVTQGGTSILPHATAANQPMTIQLGPNEPVIITYGGTLTANVMVH